MASRENISLFEDTQERQRAEVERVRSLIQEGADDLERGAVIDGPAFFDEWNEELDALGATRNKPREAVPYPDEEF